jgi:tetratricopeptide (TPR) repeat protein
MVLHDRSDWTRDDGGSTVLQLIRYYFRCQLYGKCITLSSDVSQSLQHAPSIMFWKAWSTAMLGNVDEAICEFEYLRHRYEDIAYTAVSAMIYFQTQGSGHAPSKEEMHDLKSALSDSKQICSDEGWILAAYFQYGLGNSDIAVRYLEKCSAVPSPKGNVDAVMCRFWGGLRREGGLQKKGADDVRKWLASFDDCDAWELDRRLLLSMCTTHISELDITSLSCPSVQLVLWLERSKSYGRQSSFEEAFESIENALTIDPENLEGLRCYAMMSCLNRGVSSALLEQLERLFQLVQGSNEKHNDDLMFLISQCFARLSFVSRELLPWTIKLIKHLLSSNPDQPRYHEELGFQLNLAGDVDTSLKRYNKVCSVTPTDICYLGIVRNLLAQDKLDEAEIQLEYMRAATDSASALPDDLVFLQARLCRKRREIPKYLVQMEEVARRIQDDVHGGDAFGLAHLQAVQFEVQFVAEVFTFCSASANKFVRLVASGATGSLLARGRDILRSLKERVLGCPCIFFMSARFHFHQDDIESCIYDLERCLELDEGFVPAHLLYAQAQASNGKDEMALQLLSGAASVDAATSDALIYKALLCGIKERNQDPYDIEVLHEALKDVLGFQSAEAPDYLSFVSDTDVVAAVVQCANALSERSRLRDAIRLLSTFRSKYSDTPHEMYVVEAMARLTFDAEGSHRALEILNDVYDDSFIFEAATLLKADLALLDDGDVQAHGNVYKKMATRVASAEAYNMLGDALVENNRPLKGIAEGYDKSLQLRPKQPEIFSKIILCNEKLGRASEAIKYCKTACQLMPTDIAMVFDISEVYLRADKNEEALSVLCHLLLSKYDEVRLEARTIIAVLSRTADIQEKLGLVQELEKTLLKLRGALETEKTKGKAFFNRDAEDESSLLKVCLRLARCMEYGGKHEEAEKQYKAALGFDQTTEVAAIALSNHYLNVTAPESIEDIIEGCQSCGALELQALSSFWQGSLEEAISQYSQLRKMFPTNFMILASYLDVMRRGGQLDVANEVVALAQERAMERDDSNDAGLLFCQGLHACFKGNLFEAVKILSSVRKTAQGSIKQKALERLLEIHLYEIPGLRGKPNFGDVKTMIEELKQCGPELQRSALIFESMYLAATKKEESVAKGHEILDNLLKVDVNYIPAIFASAQIAALSGADAKAKTLLKKAVTIPFRTDCADEIERAQLALAKIFDDEEGKDALVKALCNKCLSVNKSCFGAHKILSRNAERHNQFHEALEHYVKAQDLLGQPNSVLAVKTARLSMKCGDHVKALDTLEHKIDSNDPAFGALKKEVLVNCVTALRP